MKFAIYCCLLALCASQIAHAVAQKDLDTACNQYEDLFHKYLTKKQGEFKNAAGKSKMTEEKVDDCEEDFNAKLKEKIPNVEKLFTGCKYIKSPHINIQSAKDCCSKTNKNFGTWLDTIVKNAIKCVCPRPAACKRS